MVKINKFEAAGIFASIAVMAIALVAVRFEFTGTPGESSEASAARGEVIVVDDESESAEETQLVRALTEATALGGAFTKLVIDDVRIGDGREVTEGDRVTVHYIGTTREGIQFDSSYARGEPFTFTVGAGTVIDGWEQGLIGMREGGQRILVIPPEMAYGDLAVGPIEPNSVLVFAVELLSVESP